MEAWGVHKTYSPLVLLRPEALGQLYVEGFADLERHFAILEVPVWAVAQSLKYCGTERISCQELLAKKLSSRKAVLQAKRIKQEASKDSSGSSVRPLWDAS